METFLKPGSYFCSLLGEHARPACSKMFGEHSVEQAPRQACSAHKYLLGERNPEHKKFARRACSGIE
uniref:Uncharacterized protein n=1 Tax=Romanomermis culicivorax TaxID=13658 RepID=A0A915K6E7_ROMCU